MNQPLIVIKPTTVTDAMLVSTNVTEADYAAWSSGTTYALAARVIVTTGVHKIYESLQAGNTNKDPTSTANSAWWKEVSPTNRWKCLDNKRSTVTTNASSIAYRFTPGAVVNGVYLGNVVADSAQVRLIDPTDGTVYSSTVSLLSPPRTSSFYDWHFSPVERKTKALFLDVPPYYAADVLVDLTIASGNCSIGVLAFGYQQAIGEDVRLGVRVGMDDYSKKTTNEYGDTSLSQGAYTDRANFDVEIPTEFFDATREQLKPLRATPCVWVGSPDYAETWLYGWVGQFELLMSAHRLANCTLEIKELT